MVTNIPIK